MEIFALFKQCGTGDDRKRMPPEMELEIRLRQFQRFEASQLSFPVIFFHLAVHTSIAVRHFSSVDPKALNKISKYHYSYLTAEEAGVTVIRFVVSGLAVVCGKSQVTGYLPVRYQQNCIMRLIGILFHMILRSLYSGHSWERNKVSTSVMPECHKKNSFQPPSHLTT